MSARIALRPAAEQHDFNRRVWERLVNDPTLKDTIERIETDGDGNLIMSPPPEIPHRLRQNRIARLLDQLLPEGGALCEGTVSTLEGVKIADVVWYAAQGAAAVENEAILPTVPPDLCVEVLSPSNTAREIDRKMAAYFGAGVREVWICDREGKMSFYSPHKRLERSAICPDFPRDIPARFVRSKP